MGIYIILYIRFKPRSMDGRRNGLVTDEYINNISDSNLDQWMDGEMDWQLMGIYIIYIYGII